MKTAFSFDTVNTRYQEPNRNRVESKYYWEELIKLTSAGGFEAIELPFDLGFMGARCAYPFSKVVLDVKYGGAEGFKALLAESGITKIAGLQATAFPAGDADKYISGFKRLGKGMLEQAKLLECDYAILSASPEVASLGGVDKRELQEKLAAALNELAAEAGEVKLCVRNEYWGILRGAEMHSFMERVDGSVFYNVDLAHVAIAGEDPVAYIRACGERIGVVTLTDTAFRDEDESWKGANPAYPRTKPTQVFRDLGEGEIDLKGVLAALREQGYEGWHTVSNRQTKDVSRGILRARYALRKEA